MSAAFSDFPHPAVRRAGRGARRGALWRELLADVAPAPARAIPAPAAQRARAARHRHHALRRGARGGETAVAGLNRHMPPPPPPPPPNWPDSRSLPDCRRSRRRRAPSSDTPPRPGAAPGAGIAKHPPADRRHPTQHCARRPNHFGATGPAPARLDAARRARHITLYAQSGRRGDAAAPRIDRTKPIRRAPESPCEARQNHGTKPICGGGSPYIVW